MADDMQIRTEAELEAVIGEPMEWVRGKVLHALDEAMVEFLASATLALVATHDADGGIDVSPKGDPPGFVEVTDDGALLIPERLGNKLTFGFRNLLRNPEIGLIFLAPVQRETLRIKGRATLHRDPEVLERLSVNQRPALLYTRVEVTTCFLHCGKALIRSKLWDPDDWEQADPSLGARGFATLMGDTSEAAVQATQQALDQAYTDELY